AGTPAAARRGRPGVLRAPVEAVDREPALEALQGRVAGRAVDLDEVLQRTVRRHRRRRRGERHLRGGYRAGEEVAGPRGGRGPGRVELGRLRQAEVAARGRRPHRDGGLAEVERERRLDSVRARIVLEAADERVGELDVVDVEGLAFDGVDRRELDL